VIRYVRREHAPSLCGTLCANFLVFRTLQTRLALNTAANQVLHEPELQDVTYILRFPEEYVLSSRHYEATEAGNDSVLKCVVDSFDAPTQLNGIANVSRMRDLVQWKVSLVEDTTRDTSDVNAPVHATAGLGYLASRHLGTARR